MINGKKVVALIPARGGSKSIPGKNIRPIAGKPLINWTIETAFRSQYIDRIIVSTDSSEISEVAISAGSEVIKRPDELAQDTSLVIDTVRHVISTLAERNEFMEYLILLEPTSPLRTEDDIDKCIELLDCHEFDSVASFCEAEINPHRIWKVENGRPSVFIDGAIPWLPRQKLPKAYQLNGAVYGLNSDKLPEDQNSLLFGNIGAYIMPPERSVDIDHRLQFLLVEQLLKERHHENFV
jgi:CMP-N-acetylneuraminic acid synthetase